MKEAKGLTLLEVLVALAIFALSALALLQSMGHQALGPARLADRTWADWVAENQLVELRLHQTWPPLYWTSGSSIQAGRNWYWRWRGVEGEYPGFRKVEIEVSATPWKQGGVPLTLLHGWVAKL